MVTLSEVVILFIFFSFCIITYVETVGNKPVSRYFHRQLEPNIQNRTYHRKKKRYLKTVKPVKQHIIIKTIPTIIMITILVLFGTNSLFFTAVLSGSMEPSFERGDLVLVQNLYTKVYEGDIILFDNGVFEYPLIHRAITSQDEGGIRTKGDANPYEDWWSLGPENIKAKAVTIGTRPIVIKNWGNFFIIENKGDLLPLFGSDYKKYQLFFNILRTYGLIISIVSIIIYISLTYRDYKNE